MPADWEVLRELFERALARSPRERAALLRELTGGDAALQHEVESLVVAHEAASQFLIEPALDRPRRNRSSPQQSAPEAGIIRPSIRAGGMWAFFQQKFRTDLKSL